MDTRKRNRKAKNNGTRIEKWVLKKIKEFIKYEKIEFVNTIIDLMIDNRPFEIKSCQQIHKNGQGKVISGRFTLDKEQHNYLIKNAGFYIFVLEDKQKKKHLKIKSAKSINFIPKLSWKKVFPELVKR